MGWTKERFEHEMRKFDPLLRLRESQTEPGVVFIERKAARESKAVPKPSERHRLDNYRRNAEGHILVMRAKRNELTHNVFLELRAHDMWEYRGAGPYADAFEKQERDNEAAIEKQNSELLHACGEEAYDRAMIKQGDVVSNFHAKV